MRKDKRLREGHLHISMPKALERATRVVAKYLNTTASGIVRSAILYYLTTVVSPKILSACESGRVEAKLRNLRLIDTIRTAITDNSAPGRLRGQRVRAAYMRYCLRSKREGQRKVSYAKWRAQHDELETQQLVGVTAV